MTRPATAEHTRTGGIVVTIVTSHNAAECAGFVPLYILFLSFFLFFAAPRRVDYDDDDEAEWSDNSRGR